ncbi:GGDEF domain-containing protein [Marinobacter sp.]|uniref:GGDEF domain-containing protein n=1 Tax=Marinobacter sp. TaxID=50741 RepID=UPI003567B01B
MRCTQIAGSVDVAFFFIFLTLASPILAWVNIVSVGMYTGAYIALKHKQNRLAAWLIWTEVIIHAALGIVLIGWDSGFHYYLLMFIPAICLSAPRKWTFPGLLMLWVYYVGLNILARFFQPLQPIPDTPLYLVHLFNLTVVFAMFSYLTVFYLGVVLSAQKRLHSVAITDSLTGLLNRRQMQYLLDQEIERFKRSGQPVSLMLMDLDHFKQINDTCGHDYGDKILRAFADILQKGVRSQDFVSRWGGEEFLVVMPQSSLADTIQTAERLRAAMESYDELKTVEQAPKVTVSIGVTMLQPGDDAARIIGRADRAMYRSKELGRNQVTAA